MKKILFLEFYIYLLTGITIYIDPLRNKDANMSNQEISNDLSTSFENIKHSTDTSNEIILMNNITLSSSVEIYKNLTIMSSSSINMLILYIFSLFLYYIGHITIATIHICIISPLTLMLIWL